MSTISSKTQQIYNLYKNNLWRGRLILATIILLLILVIVRLSLPYTIVYSAVYWLNQQGITSQIEDIRINVTEGTFTVINASGNKQGNTVFNVGKASIDWQWRPLSKKTIYIKEVILEDFNLQTAQYTNALDIGGVIIRQDGTIEQQPAEQDQPVAWGAALEQIDFKDLAFCFQQFDHAYDEKQDNKLIDYCGNIDLLTWQGKFSLETTVTPETESSTTLTADGELHIKQLNMHNNLLDGKLINTGDILLSKIKISGINDIHLDSINIDQFALLQDSGHSRHKHAVQFNELEISDITLNNTNALEIKTISLSKPVVSVAKDSKGAWKYEQWLIQQIQSDTPESSATEAQTTGKNTFSARLGNIAVTDAEACYLQPPLSGGNEANTIDYCIALADINWEGSIDIKTPPDDLPAALDLNGDLNLSKFITTNNTLNRDLLTFKALAINTIKLKAVDDLAFDKLKLNEATGLELTRTENEHTVTLSSLDISTFSYRNNTVAMNKVSINDLGLEVTQNEDGTLDFEQWKVETADQEKAEKAESPDSPAEPIKIKLDEFNLDTTRMVEFNDMSVTPNMEIGLKEIHINIKHLDQDKPQQKSPLTLSAKTKRHGTIEITGDIMPFESKPSFDATGKISGIDLRVASPKAEQAIGHIIKSGQLDADLKLLSNKGQLDSNIALVLHHFNLKAKSKEDAAALDETFGMPINQSLVLLKDKKDRIKLDIPITGDINNPDFDPTDAIIKATAKATTVTLVTFYTPYGLAYAGGNILFNLATAMNFDPLLFEPGSSQITEAHKEQLTKLAELLAERPGIHLTLCGFTNMNDREKITTEIIDKEKIKPPTKESLIKLQQLGGERQENVKNHLISVGKIEHNRLILCEPEHSDDAEAISGVEISI